MLIGARVGSGGTTDRDEVEHAADVDVAGIFHRR